MTNSPEDDEIVTESDLDGNVIRRVRMGDLPPGLQAVLRRPQRDPQALVTLPDFPDQPARYRKDPE